MRPHYSHSSRENATPSSGTSLLASFKGVPPPPPPGHSVTTDSRTFPLMLYDDSIGFSFLDILWASHFVSLKVRPESFDQASSRFRSDWRETQHQQQTWDFVDLCVRLANIIGEVNFNRWGSERRNEFFTEWHVAWLAEWNNVIIYSECNIIMENGAKK